MDRYNRQILFDKIGKEGQKKISDTIIAIVGVGALGSVSSEIFTRMGVKKLVIFDEDIVSLSNLQRQALYSEKNIGEKKVFALKRYLESINSNVEIIAFEERIIEKNISKLESNKIDIIIDGTDNMESRFILNKYSKKFNIPYIYGAAAGSIGIVYAITNNSPCLECVFGNAKNFMTCENLGIIAPITYTVASIQAIETLKIILNKNYDSKIIRFDLWKNSFENIITKQNESCTICGKNSKLLETIKTDNHSNFSIKECKTKSSFSTTPMKRINLDFKKLKKEFNVLEDAGIILILNIEGEELIVHNYGEIVFKKLKDTEKIRKIAEKIYSLSE